MKRYEYTMGFRTNILYQNVSIELPSRPESKWRVDSAYFLSDLQYKFVHESLTDKFVFSGKLDSDYNNKRLNFDLVDGDTNSKETLQVIFYFKILSDFDSYDLFPIYLPFGVVGKQYTQQMLMLDSHTGKASRPKQARVTGNRVPGLHLSDEAFHEVPAGLISGRPTEEGEFKLRIGLTDEYGQGGYDIDPDGHPGKSGWREYTVRIFAPQNEPRMTISPPLRSVGEAGFIYPESRVSISNANSISGGDTLYFFAHGYLPEGLTINRKTGVISGTVDSRASGTYHFEIEAYLADNVRILSAQQTIVIKKGLNLSFTGPERINLGEDVEMKVEVSGGGRPYQYHKITGLPDGMSYKIPASSSEDLEKIEFSGTPNKPGDHTIVIVVTDNYGYSTTKELKLVVVDKPSIDLVIGKLLHGHFTPASQGHEKLTITGQLSGAGLSETNHPDKVVLTIRQPGGSTFLDVKTLGKLEWDPHWKSDGWEFTLSEISWSAKDGVPRFEMSAALDQHTSQPAVVKFPLAEFVRNLEFRRDDEPTGPQIYVKSGDQSLSLHMAFYNALDELSAKLVLPDGVTGKVPAPDASFPTALHFRTDWDGHMQPILFEIRKDNALKVDTGKPLALNISVPINVQTTFRSGEVQAELISSNDSVEHIPNDTAPNTAHVQLTMDTSS